MPNNGISLNDNTNRLLQGKILIHIHFDWVALTSGCFAQTKEKRGGGSHAAKCFRCFQLEK